MFRTHVRVLLIATVVTAPLLSCSDDPNGPPPPTQCQGLVATVAARVDGVAWSSTTGGGQGGGARLVVGGQIQDGQGRVLSDLSFILVGVTGPGTYRLTPGSLNIPIGTFCDSRRPGGIVDEDGDCFSPFFETDATATGTVVLQSLDANTGEASGTFAFLARDQDDGSIVSITEGSFSLRCR